jgi:hypothetical protein
MRCLARHGRVFAHKAYSNGAPAHFEHQQACEGCAVTGYAFTGKATPHPHALT